MIHAHSRQSYETILPVTGACRIRVLSVIKSMGPITRQDIGLELGWAINRVTGRVRELLDSGSICEDGREYKNKIPRGLLRLV